MIYIYIGYKQIYVWPKKTLEILLAEHGTMSCVKENDLLQR